MGSFAGKVLAASLDLKPRLFDVATVAGQGVDNRRIGKPFVKGLGERAPDAWIGRLAVFRGGGRQDRLCLVPWRPDSRAVRRVETGFRRFHASISRAGMALGGGEGGAGRPRRRRVRRRNVPRPCGARRAGAARRLSRLAGEEVHRPVARAHRQDERHPVSARNGRGVGIASEA